MSIFISGSGSSGSSVDSNKYKWNRFEFENEKFFLQGYSTFPSDQGTGNMRMSPGSGSSTTYPRTVVQVADSCIYNTTTNKFELQGTTTEVTISSTSSASSIAGKYFKVTTVGYGCSGNFNTSDVYHLASGSTFSSKGSSTPSYICASYSGNTGSVSKILLDRKLKFGTSTVITSDSSNNYPNPCGIQNDYFYIYTGQLNDNITHGSKVITGSYIGTGTSGVNSVVTLQCNQTPLFMIISRSENYESYLNPQLGVIDLIGVTQYPFHQSINPNGSTTQYNWYEYRSSGLGLSSSSSTTVYAFYAKYYNGSISFYYGSGTNFNTSGEIYNYAIITM